MKWKCVFYFELYAAVCYFFKENYYSVFLLLQCIKCGVVAYIVVVEDAIYIVFVYVECLSRSLIKALVVKY